MDAGRTRGPPLSAGGAHRRQLLIVLVITTAVLVAEVVGGWLTGSLALLADAGHMFTDVAGVTLAVLAVTFANRSATDTRTYGYYRLEILAAAVNALLLFGVAVVVLYEAWQRWSEPPEVEGGLMLAFATVGLVASLVSVLLLRSGSRVSLNVKGAYLEVFGDTLGCVAVISAAIVITVTGWQRADVVASAAVALMILARSWALLREAIDVLLEAAPKGTDTARIRSRVLETPGVLDIHDLHVWTLTSGMPMLSVHVVVDDDVLANGAHGKVLDALDECLALDFGVEHCTFQLEPVGHAEHEHTPRV